MTVTTRIYHVSIILCYVFKSDCDFHTVQERVPFFTSVLLVIDLHHDSLTFKT